MSTSLPQLTLADATIGIITALKDELAAVRLVFECPMYPISSPIQNSGFLYYVAAIPAKVGGQHVVAVCSLVEMGNNMAAAVASQLLNDCPSVQQILMVGIAGAVPNPADAENHVRIGDIVVSNANGVIQYDFGKNDEITGFKYRGTQTRPSSAMLNAVRILQSDAELQMFPWEEHISKAISQRDQFKRPPPEMDELIDDQDPIPHPIGDEKWRRAAQPRVFLGSIGSSNILLKNASIRDGLRDQHRIKAVEMEASGIADATWLRGRGYLVIRGTCDYCNTHKNDAWQPYAAIIAASYARSVVEYMAPFVPTAQQPPLIPPLLSTKLDSINATLGQITRSLEEPNRGVKTLDQRLIQDRLKQLVDQISRAWKTLEHSEAIRLTKELEYLLTEYELTLSAELTVEAYLILANSAFYESRVGLQVDAKPDVSKAMAFMERAKRVLRP